LHAVVDDAIETRPDHLIAEDQKPFDISRIDFDRLRREFERSPAKHTTIQNLKTAIEQRLHTPAAAESVAHGFSETL
jgi:type I restriction enzyme R subunit